MIYVETINFITIKNMFIIVIIVNFLILEFSGMPSVSGKFSDDLISD